jgi:hypothetical protein
VYSVVSTCARAPVAAAIDPTTTAAAVRRCGIDRVGAVSTMNIHLRHVIPAVETAG